jgi:Fur family transcriptional regulator, ferric uptake regulator
MPAPPAPRRPRKTAHQQAVLDLLHRTDHFRSAQQLHFEIREYHMTRIGLTTVYRILRTLAEQKIAETQRAEDGETLYRLRANPGHRHYLLCRRCGRAVGFTPTDFELDVSEFAVKHGYLDITHHIDLYGTCQLCVAV